MNWLVCGGLGLAASCLMRTDRLRSLLPGTIAGTAGAWGTGALLGPRLGMGLFVPGTPSAPAIALALAGGLLALALVDVFRRDDLC